MSVGVFYFHSYRAIRITTDVEISFFLVGKIKTFILRYKQLIKNQLTHSKGNFDGLKTRKSL